jgi:hypothetical protein
VKSVGRMLMAAGAIGLCITAAVALAALLWLR